MKAKTIVLVLFISSLLVHAQQDSTIHAFFKTKPFLQRTGTDGIFMEGVCTFMPLQGLNAHSMGMRLGGICSPHFSLAFAFDMMRSRQVTVPSVPDPVNGLFTYAFFGGITDYRLRPNKIMSLFLHLGLGNGHISYSDQRELNLYYQYDDSTGAYSDLVTYPTPPVTANFLVAEPGMGTFVNITRCIGIGISTQWRMAIGINSAAGSSAELSGYSSSVFLRLRIPSRVAVPQAEDPEE